MGRRDKSVAANELGEFSPGAQLRLARQQARIPLQVMATRIKRTKGYLSAVETGTYPVSRRVRDLYEQELRRFREPSAAQQEASEMASAQAATWDVVVSSTIQALPPERQSYLLDYVDTPVRRVCKRFKVRCYVPERDAAQGNSLTSNLGVRSIIAGAGALIAYVGVMDLLTGMDIKDALKAQVPIIVLAEPDKRHIANEVAVELTKKGFPPYDIISFESPADLERQLAQNLFWRLSEHNLRAAAANGKWQSTEYDATLRQVRSLRQRQLETKHAVLRGPITEPEWRQTDPLAWLSASVAGKLTSSVPR